MSVAVTEAELTEYAVRAVATRYSSQRDPIAAAREALQAGPQAWAYKVATRMLKADKVLLTKARADVIWRALGGPA